MEGLIPRTSALISLCFYRKNCTLHGSPKQCNKPVRQRTQLTSANPQQYMKRRNTIFHIVLDIEEVTSFS